jgi:outer membrane lipoprotein-sorting protein
MTSTKRCHLLLAAFLAASVPAPVLAQAVPAPMPMQLTQADQALISQIEAYLNDQKGLTANFLQVAADGSTRTGKAWLERPGKMRFEYDPPDKQLLVAGFGLLVYHDPALDQTTNIPLGSTPLGILLASHVDLNSGGVVVTNIQQQAGEDDITLIRKDKPAAGSLTLVFGTNPLELRQWVVNDAQGQQTRVSLYDIVPGGPYPDSLFRYIGSSPIPSGG